MDDFWDYIFEQYESINLTSMLSIALIVLLFIQFYPMAKRRVTPRTIKKSVLKEHKSIDSSWLTKVKVRYYLPSALSVLLLSLITVVIWYVSTRLGTDADNFLDSSQLQNVLAVLAGLGVILFAFLIFIAEQARDNRDTARILLQKGLIYHISTLYVVALLVLLASEVRPIVSWVVFLLGLMVLWAMYRVLKTLFDEDLLESEVAKFIRDVYIRNNLFESVLVRFSKNKQLEYFDSSTFNIEYNPFHSDDGYEVLVSPKGFEVIDNMNIDQIELMLSKIEAHLGSKQLTILKDGGFKQSKNKEKLTESTSPKIRVPKRTSLPKIKLYVNRLIGDGVRSKTAIIVFDRENIKTELAKELVAIANEFVPKIFSLKEPRKNMNFNRLIESQQENASIAIAAKANTPLLRALSTYESVVSAFHEIILPIGNYSRKEALQESSSVFERWDFLDKLSDNYEELMLEAVKEENFKAVKSVCRSAYKVAREGIEQRNHLIFLQMVYFITHLYDYSLNSKDEQIRNYLRDRSSRYIDEIVSYQLSDLTEKGTKKDYSEYRDFITDALQAYLALLKRPVDHGNADDFKNVLGGPMSIRQRIERRYDVRTRHMTDEELEKHIESVMSDIQQSSFEVMFGITIWALAMCDKTNYDEENRLQILNESLKLLPRSFNELTRKFITLSKNDAPEKWRWNTWGAPIDGTVYSIDNDTPVARVYLLKLLSNQSQQISDESMAPIISGFDDDADAVYEIQRLFKKLKEVAQNAGSWTHRVNLAFTQDAIQSLTENIDSIIKATEKKLDEIAANRAISKVKVEDFKKAARAEYVKNEELRRLLRTYGAYKLKNHYEDNAKQYGIYQIDDKQVFFDEWYSGYAQWGETYGERFANAEEQLIFEHILSSTNKFSVNKVSFAKKLLEFIQSDEYEEVQAALTNMHDFEFKELELGDFAYEPLPHPRETNRFANLVWGDKKIPLYYGGHTSGMDFISLVNLTESFEVSKSLPKKGQKYEENVYISVEDLNSDDDARNSLIESSPSWLESKDNPEQYLRGKVRISIFTRLRLSVTTERTPGFTLNIEDSD